MMNPLLVSNKGVRMFTRAIAGHCCSSSETGSFLTASEGQIEDTMGQCCNYAPYDQGGTRSKAVLGDIQAHEGRVGGTEPSTGFTGVGEPFLAERRGVAQATRDRCGTSVAQPPG